MVTPPRAHATTGGRAHATTVVAPMLPDPSSDPLSDPSSDDDDDDARERTVVHTAWKEGMEQAITKSLASDLDGLIEKCGAEGVIRAIGSAVAHGGKSFAYVETCALNAKNGVVAPPRKARRGRIKPTFVENSPEDYRVFGLPDPDPDNDPLPWRAAMKREKESTQHKIEETEEGTTP